MHTASERLAPVILRLPELCIGIRLLSGRICHLLTLTLRVHFLPLPERSGPSFPTGNGQYLTLKSPPTDRPYSPMHNGEGSKSLI